MKSRWEQYKEKNGVTVIDAFKPSTPKVEDSIAENRFSICQSCPELIKLTTQCKQCGCFMKIKTKFELAKCPIGKW